MWIHKRRLAIGFVSSGLSSVRRLKCLIEHFEWPSRALKLADPKVLWGSPLPHLRRDWAHAFHICAGTSRTPIALKLADAKVLMKIFSPHLPKLLECHSMLLDELRTKFKAGEGVKAVSETLDFYAPFFKITVCARRPLRWLLHVVCCMLYVVCCLRSLLQGAAPTALCRTGAPSLGAARLIALASRVLAEPCVWLMGRAEPGRAGGMPQRRRRRGTLVVGRCSTSTTTQT